MTKTDLLPLSMADIETFERLVQQASDIRLPMDLQSLNGLCTALALCPHAVEPDAWLTWVWDSQSGLPEPEPVDAEVSETVHALALRQQRWVAAAMAGVDRDAVPGLVAEALDVNPFAYCEGFMVGVYLAYEHWVHVQQYQPDWLLPLQLLGKFDTSTVEALDDDSLVALVDTVAPSLIDIREHWRGQQHPAADPLAAWVSVRQALLRFSKPFPHDAVVLAHAQRRVVAPQLVQLLEDLARDPTPARDDDYRLHLFGIALLGCWREPAAYRPLLALGRLDQAVLDDVLGDTLYDLYFRALASVCDGDLQPLQAMIEDDGVSIRVRSVLLEAWRVRVLEGDASMDVFEAFLLDFGQRCADRVRQSGRADFDQDLIDDVAAAACDVGAGSLAEPVREWIAERLIDPRSIDTGHFEDEMARTWADRQQSLRRSGQGYIWDVADELRWWGGYEADREPVAALAPSVAEALPARPVAQAPKPLQQPLVRESPKVGRNDPCPCGSGRKYKKCHGAG